MSDTIVLVRHGKAEAPQEGQEDSARTLTAAGARALSATLPDALAPVRDMVREGATLAVWASPAIRACQTADIVCSALGAKDYEPHEILGGSDPEAIRTEAQAATADIVVLVGHTPVLDKTAQILSGCRLPFEPGGVACLRTKAELGQATNLRWFAQGPDTSNWDRTLLIEEAVKELGCAIEQYFYAFIDNPADVRAIHSMRVFIRRLRSLLTFSSLWLKDKPTRRTQANLRELAGLTSRLRDYDVFAQRVATLKPPADDLAQAVARKRASQAQRTLDAFKTRKAKRALNEACATARHLPWRDSVVKGGITADQVKAYYEGLRADFEEAYTQLDIADVDATHDVRKEAKLLRYVVRNMPGLFDGETTEIEKRMRKIQKNLGRLCDARVNLDMCDSFPKKALTKQAKEDLVRLRAKEEARLARLLGDA